MVETDEGQEIWLSTNEGEDPQRLIFSKRGTTFTSLVFSPNGERLWWTAEHAEGYPELHFMNLDTRTGFGTAWRGTEGTVAGGLKLAPAGPLAAVTEGADCEEHEALVLSNGLTSAVGLAYWVLAARLFPPAAVGVNSVAIMATATFGAELLRSDAVCKITGMGEATA
mgnify:CR=1 FL=1